MEQDLAGGIAVLDFGGQYAHLICRRVRALGVYAALMKHDVTLAELERTRVSGVILSGGPASVYAKGAPKADPALFAGRTPVLGICYGYQLMVKAHGGEVGRGEGREYGKSRVEVVNEGELFDGLGEGRQIVCWMSHSDSALALPPSMKVLAKSDRSPYAAVRLAGGRQFGVQFHPEVTHTQSGQVMLSNFVFRVCRAERKWSMEGFLERSLDSLSKLRGRVLCAVSGGVDSAVVAVLMNRALGKRATAVFIETGLLRAGEGEAVRELLGGELGLQLRAVDASERFLGSLRGVVDPEEKRRVVGRAFAEVFESFAREEGPFHYLAQGTLYPDVIESGESRGPATVIKTHHNVGGLPPGLTMKLVEPLRELYKDEVRELASILGLSRKLIDRHPFPGPGLAVRVVGEVTGEKLAVCRESSRVVEEVLREAGLYDRVWQAFAYVGDDMVTGVLGDERKVGHQVTVKVVESADAMTADWSRLPPEVLERISTRITNEVSGVVATAYSVSSKPPATIEPQ